jgi:hypothetical protein
MELTDMPSRAAKSDNASSVYSRSTVIDIAAPQVFLDRPRLFSIDREIAVINGTSIALDLTGPQLQRSKKLLPPSPEERRREVLSYEHENRFYSQCIACFDGFRQETESVARLLSAYHFFNTGASTADDPHLGDCLKLLDQAFRDWSTQLRDAQEQYNQFWKTRPAAVWI